MTVSKFPARKAPSIKFKTEGSSSASRMRSGFGIDATKEFYFFFDGVDTGAWSSQPRAPDAAEPHGQSAKPFAAGRSDDPLFPPAKVDG